MLLCDVMLQASFNVEYILFNLQVSQVNMISNLSDVSGKFSLLESLIADLERKMQAEVCTQKN